jgi:DNA-binding MarR family transcriptional regulator
VSPMAPVQDGEGVPHIRGRGRIGASPPLRDVACRCGADRGCKGCDVSMNTSVDHTNVVDAEKTTPDPRLGADLLAVVAQLHRVASERIKTPLTAAQARLLATIEVHKEARIGDLAAVDHCSQSTITTHVRRLESIGLVGRTGDPGDARSVRIHITPEGIRALSAVTHDRAAAIEPQLAMLEAKDRQVLANAVEVLGRLADNAAITVHRKTLRPANSACTQGDAQSPAE